MKISGDVCRFCGTNCNSSLALKLTSGSMAKGTYKAQSNCSYQYPFSMASAAHGSANNPCTNIPINCNECENTVIWSCSLNLHYLHYYLR